MAITNLIECEHELKFSGSYTYQYITDDISAAMELWNEDTQSGYNLNAVSYRSTTSPWLSNMTLVSGANKSFTCPVNTTHIINTSVVYPLYVQNGNQVNFYIPFASIKIAANKWLYAGLYIDHHFVSSGTHYFTKHFNLWEIDAPDANDATTRTQLRHLGGGDSNLDYVCSINVCRSPFFATALPAGTEPNPPMDEYCIRFSYFMDQQAGTTVSPRNITYTSNSSGVVTFNEGIMFSVARNYTVNNYMIPEPSTIPYHGGTSGPGGGNGSFSGASDTIALPGNPSMGVTSAGFIRVYNIGVGGLSSLGFELFPPLSYTAPTPIGSTADAATAIVDGFNAIVTFLANTPSFFEQIMANTLINYVIDCHVIPVNPGSGSSEQIHVGPKTLTTAANRIYTDYVDVSCGSINIAEFYASFADFITSAKLYLPFIGFVPVRPEWWQATTLSVDYKFNIIDGSFACYVRSGGKYVNNGGGGTIVGQYGGVACMHIPITGVSYSSMVSGLIGAGSGMLAGAGSGNIAAAASSAIEAATTRGDIATSNSYSSSAAFLGCRVPFLMIERPVASYSENYQHEIGIPSNIYAKLGDVPGFVQMTNVHLDGIPCTDEERKYIANALRSGVIV